MSAQDAVRQVRSFLGHWYEHDECHCALAAREASSMGPSSGNVLNETQESVERNHTDRAAHYG